MLKNGNLYPLIRPSHSMKRTGYAFVIFFRQIDFHASCQTHGDEVLHAFCQSLFQPDSATAKGSQWIAITHRLRDYFFDYLQTNPDYLQAFKYSHGADEIFFQTLLCNSPFADRNADYSLVYTDWSCPGAHPKTFTTDDLYPLSEFDSQNRRENPQSATLFARKFDDALDIARYRTIILGELQNQHNQNPAN